MTARPMLATDAAAVAALHQAHLAGLLHDLGPAVAARFYRQALALPETVALVVGEPAQGYVFGTTEADQFYRRVLRRSPWSLVPSVALRLLGRPGLWRSVLAPTRPAAGPELLFVALAPELRGAGHGGRLLRAFETELVRRGCAGYELSVEADNAAAIAVYEHLGLELLAEFSEYGLGRRRYGKRLAAG